MTRCAAQYDTPEQRTDLPHRQVGTPVRGHQQRPISQVQGPLPARPTVSDRVPATLGDQTDQPPELSGLQPGERRIHSGRAAEITCTQASSTVVPNGQTPGLRDVP